MKSDRNAFRLALGEAAVFSLNKAAELLPLGDGEARAWLEARGLVRHVNGRPIVRWRDVLEALDDGALAALVPPSPSPANLPRVRL